MMTSTLLSFGAMLCAVSQSTDVPNPLSLVPAEAACVIHVRGLPGTTKRIGDFVKKALPAYGPQFDRGLAAYIKQMQADGRTLTGVPVDGSVIAALLDVPQVGGDIPRVLVIARVTNYKKFRDGLFKPAELKKHKGFDTIVDPNNHPVYVFEHRGYAVLTSSLQVARSYGKKWRGLDQEFRQRNIDSASFLKEDISLYGNLTSVFKVYREEIRAFQKAQNEALKSLPRILVALRVIMEAQTEALGNSSALVANMSFRPDGLVARLHNNFAGNNKTNELLKNTTTRKLKQIDNLPVGYAAYTQSVSSLDKIFLIPTKEAWIGPFAKAKGNLIPKTVYQQMHQAGIYHAYEMVALKSHAYVRVWHCKKPENCTAAQRQFFECLDPKKDMVAMPLKKKLRVMENVQSYRGFKLHHVEFEFDITGLVRDQSPQTQLIAHAINTWYGKKQGIWFGDDGKSRCFAVNAANWQNAKAMLDQVFQPRSPLSKSKAYRTTLSQLPDKTTTLLVYHVPSIAAWISDLAHTGLELVGYVKKWPAPKGQPLDGYVGVALTMEPGHVGVDAFLSANTIKEFERVFKPLIDEFQQGQPLAVVQGKLANTDPLDTFLETNKSHHKVHAIPLEAGVPYVIDLKATFDPFLRIEDARKNPLLANDDVNVVKDLSSRIVFTPAKKDQFRLIVTSFKGGATGAYELSVTKTSPAGKPTIINNKLAKTDKQDGGKYYKVHTVKLTAGQPCTFQLKSGTVDTFLVLLDATGNQLLGKNDDVAPGNTRESRLDYTPAENGMVQIVVTSYAANETGAYTLTVQPYQGRNN